MKFTELLDQFKATLGITKLNFASIELEGGTILIINGSLEVGATVAVELDGEQVPAPAGEYIMADGTTKIVIDENSKISDIVEITPADTVEQTSPEPAATPAAPAEDMGCGTKKEKMGMVCPSCGTEIEDETATVCPNCGAEMAIVPEEKAPENPETPAAEAEAITIEKINEKVDMVIARVSEMINQMAQIIEIAQGTNKLYERVEKMESDIEDTKKMIPAVSTEPTMKFKRVDDEIPTDPYEARKYAIKQRLIESQS